MPSNFKPIYLIQSLIGVSALPVIEEEGVASVEHTVGTPVVSSTSWKLAKVRKEHTALSDLNYREDDSLNFSRFLYLVHSVNFFGTGFEFLVPLYMRKWISRILQSLTIDILFQEAEDGSNTANSTTF